MISPISGSDDQIILSYVIIIISQGPRLVITPSLLLRDIVARWGPRSYEGGKVN